MTNRTKRIDEKRVKFLASLAEGNSVARAAGDAGVGRSTAYEWREAEPEFASAWDDAVETGTDALEDEAVKRAKNGSDTLLIFMLKARRREKFAERPVRLALPQIGAVSDVLKAFAETVAAMARGDITPDEAATVAGVLDAKRRAIETVELEQRIRNLEQKTGERT